MISRFIDCLNVYNNFFVQLFGKLSVLVVLSQDSMKEELAQPHNVILLSVKFFLFLSVCPCLSVCLSFPFCLSVLHFLSVCPSLYVFESIFHTFSLFVYEIPIFSSPLFHFYFPLFHFYSPLFLIFLTTHSRCLHQDTGICR